MSHMSHGTQKLQGKKPRNRGSSLTKKGLHGGTRNFVTRVTFGGLVKVTQKLLKSAFLDPFRRT